MNTLFIATAATVVAINKQTGAEIWRTALPRSGLGGCEVTSLALDNHLIFAHARGELFCLEQKTGRIRWSNGLSGLGYRACIIAVPGDSASLQNHAAAIVTTSRSAD